MTQVKLTEDDYTEDDIGELRGALTELLSSCTALVDQYGTGGTWTPSPYGILTELDDSADLFAELSRLLARSRKSVRRVGLRVRRRHLEQRCDRASEIGGENGHFPTDADVWSRTSQR